MTKRLELPKFQAFDGNGDPLSGGLVYTYAAGTDALKTTYSDYDASTPNANPVELDPRGEAVIYLIGSYKIVLKDSAGATIWTMDNITGGLDTAGLEDFYFPDATATDQGVTGDSDTIKYAVDTIDTSHGSIYLNHDSGSATTTYTLTTSEIIGADISLIIDEGAIIDGAGTLTLDNPSQIKAGPNQQIFGSSLTVTITNPGDVYPKWYPVTADGSTDDTTAWQQMVTGLADNFTVHVPEGTTILSNITSFNDVKLVGNKESCILKHKASATDHMLEMSGDVEIDGVGFNGNDANQTGRYDVIYFDGGILKIRNSYFTKSVNASVFVNAADEIDISHNHFIDIADHGGALNEVSSAISIQPSTNVTRIIIGNNFFENAAPLVSDDLAAVAIYIAALSANCRDVAIHDNSFVGLGCSYISNVQGVIDIYKNADRISITNNKFKNYYYIPIRVCDSDALVISGNLMQTAATDYSATGSAAISILPYNHDTNAKYHGIITSNQILDHTVGDIGIGIYISGNPAADTSRYIISDNIITDVTYGIYLEYIYDNVQISNNIMKTSVVAVATYGVYLQRDHGTININGGLFDGFDYGVYGLGTGATINDDLEANITGCTFHANDEYDILLRGEVGALMTSVKISGCQSIGTDTTGFASIQYVDEVLLEGNLSENKTINNENNTIVNSHGNNFANFYNVATLANDATPSIAGGELFLTGGTTAITDFDDGVTGQIITIIAEHGIDITDGTNIFLSGSATWSMTATDTLTLICKEDNKWYEIARSDSGA